MRLPIVIHPQPNDHTCGPTSLHAVYAFWEHRIDLLELIEKAPALEEGGPLGVLLGIDALRRSYDATIYTFNLQLWDPTWAGLPIPELRNKLAAQAEAKKKQSETSSGKAYLTFFELGGKVKFDPLTPSLFNHFFDRGIPVLAGLSATYLYKSAREYSDDELHLHLDDVKGEPMGHFVVLCGHEGKFTHVADPWKQNPFSNDHFYLVDTQILINAVHLGVVTYATNLLVVTPRKKKSPANK
jgi:hypothetical protein